MLIVSLLGRTASIPCFVLLVALAAPGLAQPSSDPAPSAEPSTGSTSHANPAPSVAADKDKRDSAMNARLAPGGVVAGSDGFPLHINATLSNWVGNGLLAATEYQRQPLWGSSLLLRPSAVLPKPDWFPRTILSGNVEISIANWLPAFTNSTAFEQQLRVSDFSTALIFPALLREDVLSVSFTPVLSARLPLSISSRHQNLLFSAAGAGQFAWNSPELVGTVFTVLYTPGFRGHVFGDVAATVPCSAEVLQSDGRSPIDGLTAQLPLAIGRAEELAPDGGCRLAGRQNVADMSHSATLSWTASDHNVAATLSWSVGFLRPLSSSPDLRSPNASGQNFVEMSSGSVAYTYTVPVDFQLFISAGISSGQPAFALNGKPRFPFFDFLTPANNFSSGFVDLVVGI